MLTSAIVSSCLYFYYTISAHHVAVSVAAVPVKDGCDELYDASPVLTVTGVVVIESPVVNVGNAPPVSDRTSVSPFSTEAVNV